MNIEESQSQSESESEMNEEKLNALRIKILSNENIEEKVLEKALKFLAESLEVRKKRSDPRGIREGQVSLASLLK